MKWYEAIFGDNLWNHLVIEVSFWEHTKSAIIKRRNSRGVSKLADFIFHTNHDQLSFSDQ